MTADFFIKFLPIPDTIAFHSVLTSYSSIPDESTLIFNEVLLNEGDGYVHKTVSTIKKLFILITVNMINIILSINDQLLFLLCKKVLFTKN